ncbi:hypothetical protein [Brevundimonas sp.]|uniref:hypothetical protein n=1 Tax=Brevundimonas sp. TaxID=1871086 RepID=UPI0035AE6B34
MHIRATFTIEILAEGLGDAADHQRRLEAILGDLQSQYPDVQLTLTERRRQRGPVGAMRGAPRDITGRVNRYANGRH